MKPRRWLLFLVIWCSAAAQPVKFREHVLASDLKGGYQIVPLDVNRDGKPDLVALAMELKSLVWFENPGWQRHVMPGGFSQMVNLTACRSDADGFPELVLAHEFSSRAKNSVGTVSVLRHGGHPERPWTVTEVDRLPTAHRLRCADIDGSGAKVVVNAPLTGASAEPPDYRGKTPLVFYRPGEWKRQFIGDENEGVVHGIYVYDWDGDGRDEILTASFGGIHVYGYEQGGRWKRSRIAQGDPAPWPKSGASDVTVGRLGNRRFLVSIEPWHGHQVVVYREENREWCRAVIDDSLVDGHALVAADLNGDARDEIIAGHRGQSWRVSVYYADDERGEKWTRELLDDGGISAADCAVADLNGDRRPDIACIGTATANLKWYENLGQSRP